MPALSNAWAILTLFIIPIGGGIPAGVLLAQSRGIAWEWTAVLYFISDVMLACVFEPLMLLTIAGAKRSRFLKRFSDILKKSTKRTTDLYGSRLGPLALIGISFGVDPMTGRVVAKAMGHGFITGWMIAITGDMFYFGLIMASTLWLHDILGDGTAATLIILVLMTVVPILVRRYRSKK